MEPEEVGVAGDVVAEEADDGRGDDEPADRQGPSGAGAIAEGERADRKIDGEREAKAERQQRLGVEPFGVGELHHDALGGEEERRGDPEEIAELDRVPGRRIRRDREDGRGGFVADGFPRTVAQASALDGIMDGRDPLIVLDMVVPEAELGRRLGGRLICEDWGTNAPVAHGTVCLTCGGLLVQRPDDNQSVVLERLKVYHRQSEPLVEYYRVRQTFRSIDGAQAPDEVAADLVAAIEAAGHANASRGGEQG